MNPVFTDPIASQLGNWAADITIGSILLFLLIPEKAACSCSRARRSSVPP